MGGPFFIRLRLKQKRGRYVGFMDRAKLFPVAQCVVRGPRLGQHLGSFYGSRPPLSRNDGGQKDQGTDECDSEHRLRALRCS